MINMNDIWYREPDHIISKLLSPLSWLFAVCVSSRQWLYQQNYLRSYCYPVPVIVVGNITVGGTGKTPLVIGLANFLKSKGYKPGIVSRGVGGPKQDKPYCVRAGDSYKKIGDEAQLLAQNTHCPIVLCTNRAKAVAHLINMNHVNVILSDDGLQHYRLKRAIEIAVVDGTRLFGNDKLLPAGPLREHKNRLNDVDFVVFNTLEKDKTYTFYLKAYELISVTQPKKRIGLDQLQGKKIHAIAGIGNPQRFFDSLKQYECEIIAHVFPDHHIFSPNDVKFDDNLPVLMTEKDAVKCQAFANEDCWYLKVVPVINETFLNHFLKYLTSIEELS